MIVKIKIVNMLQSARFSLSESHKILKDYNIVLPCHQGV